MKRSLIFFVIVLILLTCVASVSAVNIDGLYDATFKCDEWDVGSQKIDRTVYAGLWDIQYLESYNWAPTIVSVYYIASYDAYDNYLGSGSMVQYEEYGEEWAIGQMYSDCTYVEISDTSKSMSMVLYETTLRNGGWGPNTYCQLVAPVPYRIGLPDGGANCKLKLKRIS